MSPQRLSRMANQIAQNFGFNPDRERAKAEIVGHLVKFWTPAMRQELIRIADTQQALLSELAAEAIEESRARLVPDAD